MYPETYLMVLGLEMSSEKVTDIFELFQFKGQDVSNGSTTLKMSFKIKKK